MERFNCGDRVRVVDEAEAAPRSTHGKEGTVIEVWERLPEREYAVYAVQLGEDNQIVDIEEYDLNSI